MVRLEVDWGGGAYIMGRPGYAGQYSESSAEPMTAIVRIVTPEGVVIAADGCACDDSNQQISTMERKIFATANPPCWTLAFGLSETPSVTFTNESKPDVRMLFREDCEHMARLMVTRGDFGDLRVYAKAFSDSLKAQIQARVLRARAEDKISDSDCSSFLSLSKALRIQFAGYFKGAPSIATTRIIFATETSTELVSPSPGTVPAERFYDFYPSEEVSKLLISVDEDYSQYGQPRRIKVAKNIVSKYRIPEFDEVAYQTISIDGSIKVSRAFINACADPEAPELDPLCRGIGGHIHIATITPVKGFDWVSSLEPVELGGMSDQ